MPDFPAQDIDISRKLSLDPGTERLATKDEMIALIERGAQPERSAKRSKRRDPLYWPINLNRKVAFLRPAWRNGRRRKATKKSGSGAAHSILTRSQLRRAAVPIPENYSHRRGRRNRPGRPCRGFWISIASGLSPAETKERKRISARESGKRGFDRVNLQGALFAAREFAQHRFVDGEFEGRFR